MKITHVTEAWRGGISSYVQTLMRQQIAAGHEVALVYDPKKVEDGFKPVAAQLYTYASSRSPLKFMRCAKAVQRHLRDFQPDIVHLHSTFPGVYGRVLKPEFQTVYCAHGWAFTQERGFFKRLLYASVERVLARRCNGIVNISQFEYRSAKAFGIDAPVHDVVLSGVDDMPRQPASANSDTLKIGFIGRLDYKKGFDLLYAYARDHAPSHVQFHVLGTPDRDAKDYAPLPNMVFHGWVPADEIADHIRGFDAVIVPSRHEGFGLVAVEAMRSGVPAIVASGTALPELVTHGVNGFVFDLKTMTEDLNAIFAQDFSRLGEAARRIYEEKFTSARMAMEMEAFYKRARESHAKRSS